jgi:hypothetical protein
LRSRIGNTLEIRQLFGGKPVSSRTSPKTNATEERTKLEPSASGKPKTITSMRFESLYWDKELNEMLEERKHVDNQLAWMSGLDLSSRHSSAFTYLSAQLLGGSRKSRKTPSDPDSPRSSTVSTSGGLG